MRVLEKSGIHLENCELPILKYLAQSKLVPWVSFHFNSLSDIAIQLSEMTSVTFKVLKVTS